MFLRTGRLFVLAFEEIGGVVQPCGIVALAQGVHAVFEVVEILAVVGPAHLGDGGQTRQQHVLQVRERGDILGPQVALHAEDVGTLPGRKLVVGVQFVDLAHRDIAADGHRLLRRGLGLVVVQVAMDIGRHDDVVAGLGRRNAALRAAPRHDGRRGRNAAFENLVPADDLPAVLAEPLLHAAHRVALKLELVLQPLGPDDTAGTVSSCPSDTRRHRCG